jgi:hypothetical protein
MMMSEGSETLGIGTLLLGTQDDQVPIISSSSKLAHIFLPPLILRLILYVNCSQVYPRELGHC